MEEAQAQAQEQVEDEGVQTSPPHAALGAEPLPGGDGLGALPNAAHVVGCWAAITAQQASPEATQHTQVGVAILFKLYWRCCCCCCCLASSAAPFLFAALVAVLVSLH